MVCPCAEDLQIYLSDVFELGIDELNEVRLNERYFLFFEALFPNCLPNTT